MTIISASLQHSRLGIMKTLIKSDMKFYSPLLEYVVYICSHSSWQWGSW